MLRKGQRFTLNGTRYRVEHVTPWRAYCIGVTTVRVTVSNKKTGAVRSFTARRYDDISISPDTSLELLAEFEAGKRQPVFPVTES